MTEMNDTMERIERGAAWLDRTDPGWASRVHLPSLDLNMPCQCVLGQVVGTLPAKVGGLALDYNDCVADNDPTYWGSTLTYVKSFLPRGTKKFAMTHKQAKARGFHAVDGEDWDALTTAWKRLILARRRAAHA